MKKFLLFLFVSVLLIDAYPEDKGFSRWSIAPEYGYNKFDGDINQDLTQIIPASLMQTTYGANIEYALTPIWGLALNYYYFPLRAKNTAPPVAISTNLYSTDLSATFNLLRLVFPQSRSKIYLNMSIGLGFAFYNFNVTPAASAITSNHSNAITIPFTSSLEYNISKPFAIGVKVHYRGFNKDDLEGVKALNYKGVTNDFIGAGTVFIRYKINSRKKDHVRNLKMNVFSPEEGLTLARINAERMNKMDTVLNKLDKKVDNLEMKVDNQGKRIDSLYVTLSNEGPDTDGDGVPDVRDLEPDTPPNTPVDFWGRALKIPQFVGTATRIDYYEEIPSVYFDFDSFRLDDNALISVSKVAARMKANPSLYVEVRGYCDYSGNNPFNNRLSQLRSDRVKTELVKVWKIPSDHIIANGKGKVIEPRSKYRPNRKCEFFFSR
jgi:outer membrane protein OmpA-like peptidoglycan-associated protein